MRRVSVLLLLALAGACNDGPAGPEPIAGIDILLDSVPLEEEALRVGESVQLTASLSDAAGRPLPGRWVAWRSTAPAVAAVDSSGLVSGLSVGEALIIASGDRAADTVHVTVLSPVSLPDELACAPGEEGLRLRLGEVTVTSPGEQPLLCVDGGAGSEYTLIPFHAAASTARLAVEVAAGGVVPALGPPAPALTPSRAASLLGSGEIPPVPDEAFHHRLRAWEREHAATLRAGARARGPSASLGLAAATRAAPALGDTLHLNANALVGCTRPDLRVGRVEAITERAIVLADTANPAGGFTRDEYRAFGVAFDTLVWPVDVRNFGEPSDMDRNGRVLIFFTRAVNELSDPGSASVVAGFFYGRDLLTRPSCAGSNEAEMFYMLVPDPTGTVNRTTRSKAFVSGTTVSVLAHELQHLINLSRRTFINNATTGEETWLNEGLSHIAEELIFYEATGLRPEEDLSRSVALAEPIREKFIEYQSANFGRYLEYLKNPANASPLADDDELSTRGATWAFLRYAADRKADPAGQRQIWFDLVNSRTAGIQNLENVLGAGPLDWLQDWTVSVYTDDASLPVAERFLQPSWNFRSIFPAFQSAGGKYPLSTVPLESGERNQRRFSLHGGGAAFLRFGVAAGEQAAIRTSSGGVAAPPELRTMIVRTK